MSDARDFPVGTKFKVTSLDSNFIWEVWAQNPLMAYVPGSSRETKYTISNPEFFIDAERINIPKEEHVKKLEEKYGV